MLVVTRYRVQDGDQAAFLVDARAALAALTDCRGCLSGHLGRAVDEPSLWTLTTGWDSVGNYRRALSSFAVKLVAVPLMYRAIDEPSAFEELVVWSPSGGLADRPTTVAADGGLVGPGRAGTPSAPTDLP